MARPGRKPLVPGERLVPVMTKLPASVRDELKAEAEKRGVTLSSFVRELLWKVRRG